MSRFKHLEFPDENEREDIILAETKEESREDYLKKHKQRYLEEANKNFLWGNYEKALFYYGRILEYENDPEVAWIGQIKSLLCLNETSQAITWADKALEVLPQCAELLALKGVILAKSGNFLKAMEYSDAALEIKRSKDVWLCRGRCLLEAKKKGADFCFSEALGSNPNDGALNQEIGLIYLEYENYALALHFLNRATENLSPTPYLFLKIGECQEKLGFTNRAEISYHQALKLDSLYEPAQKKLISFKKKSIIHKIFPFWRS